jgi:1-acyl-sn-glycerol-3-phosphate acyltransferase
VKSWLRHPLRVTLRLLWMGAELSLAMLRYVSSCAVRAKAALPAARAAWLQQTASRLLPVFGIRPEVRGEIPAGGLLVCNHLSYLDILVLAALAPCVFVAKQEVKSWPVFGWFAQLGGTVFVRRERRSQAAQTVDEIELVLRSGQLVILFPEGTSSSGDTVLPFKSSLLEPAVNPAHPLAVGCLHYELETGDVREEVCYWKDMTLVPHLVNLCSKRGLRAQARFKPVPNRSPDRKELARQLHAAVLALKPAALKSNP